MSRDVLRQSAGTTTNIFEKSIRNILALGEQLELIDGRFGKIEQRIVAIKSSLFNLTSQTTKSRGNDVPIKDLTKRLQQNMTKGLRVTEDHFEKTFDSMDNGSFNGNGIKEDFSSLEYVMNNKLFSGTREMVTELKNLVQEVKGEPDSTIKHYLIDEISKLNHDIVRKVIEQMNNQFTHIKAEVDSPLSSHHNKKDPLVFNTKRDHQFKRLGIEEAVMDMLLRSSGRSEIPITAMFQAMKTFKASHPEKLKVFQNFMQMDGYQMKDSQGNMTPDIKKVEKEVGEVMHGVKQKAGLYAIDYADMSKVSSIASRVAENKEEALTFMDFASMIHRLDNEGDLVNTIALGLESLMKQFGLSIWHMDEVVKSFGLATNISKTTTEDLMKVLMESGATFSANKIGITEASMMVTNALQALGLGGEDIANMFKTIHSRLGMSTVHEKLSHYGIDVYEQDGYGRNVKRKGLDVYTDIGNLVARNKIEDKTLDDVFQLSANGFRIDTFRSYIQSFNDIGMEIGNGQNIHDMIKKAINVQLDAIFKTLSKSLSSNIIDIERAKVEFNVSLTNVFESITPLIQNLADVIVHSSHWVEKNSEVMSELVAAINNTFIGSVLSCLNKSNVHLSEEGMASQGLSGEEHKEAKPATLMSKGKTLGKTIGRFGWQMALSYGADLIDNTISDVVKDAELSPIERKIRDKTTEIDVVDEFTKMKELTNEGKWAGVIYKVLEHGDNTIRDMFSPGNQYVGYNDLANFQRDFDKWALEKYKTTDINKIVEKHNANLKEGDKEWTIADVTKQYKKDSGLYEELDALNDEKFRKEYEKMNIEQGKKDDMKREYHHDKSKSDLKKWSNGEEMEFISDTLGTMKTKLQELRTENVKDQTAALLSGVKSNSVEFLALKREQLQEEMKVYEHQKELSKRSIETYREQLAEMERTGEQFEKEKNGRKVTSKKYKSLQSKLKKEELRDFEVEKEFSEYYDNLKVADRRMAFQIAKRPIDDRLEDTRYNRQIADMKTILGTVENSRQQYDEKIRNAQTELASLQSELVSYQNLASSQNNEPSLDVDGELKNIIRSLEKSILDQTIELKNLRLSRALAYREDLKEFDDNQEIDMLRQRLSFGGVDVRDPIMKPFRMNQLNKERSQLNKYIADLKVAQQDPNATADDIDKINAEIRELTKKSLLTQLNIYQELKNQGGSFNLPEGVRAMSQYDYMVSKGTHSNMTIQSGIGDTYVNITLPNIDGDTGSKQLSDIGFQLGQGIAAGRNANMRTQLNGNPFGYRTF